MYEIDEFARSGKISEGKGSLEMAAVSSGRSEMMDPQNESQIGVVDRLKRLYPAVNEEKTPLPRSWSPKEKYSYIGLSQSNLRVHYKGKMFSRFGLEMDVICHLCDFETIWCLVIMHGQLTNESSLF